jgi:hypothetical protein
MLCRHVRVRSCISAGVRCQTWRGQGRLANWTKATRAFQSHQQRGSPQSVFPAESGLICPASVSIRAPRAVPYDPMSSGHGGRAVGRQKLLDGPASPATHAPSADVPFAKAHNPASRLLPDLRRTMVLWLEGTAEQNSRSWCAASRLLRPTSRRFDGIAAATFDADRAHPPVARSSPPRRKALAPQVFVAARSTSSTRPHPDARPGTQRVPQAQSCVLHLAFDTGTDIVIPHRRDWR